MNPKDIFSLMNNLPKTLEKAQEEMRSHKFEGVAGNQWVSVTIDGEGTLLDIKIDPEYAKPEDVTLLQDLIKSAHRSAMEKQKEWLKMHSMGLLNNGLSG